jgi:hypothetical protein
MSKDELHASIIAQPEAVDGFYIWLLSSRKQSKRITQLEPKSNWDKESLVEMITDNTLLVAPDMVKNLFSSFSVFRKMEKKGSLIVILKSWNGIIQRM